MIQEAEQTVAFDPSYIWKNPPWHEKLFTWYVLAMLVLLLIRCVQLSVGLQRLRSGQVTASNWHEIWTVCKMRTQSLSKFAVLTFFISVHTGTISISDFASYFALQRIPDPTLFYLGVSDSMKLFSLGVAACVLLYASGFFFESRLNRHKLRFDAAAEKASLRA